jgi:hypothetical protein
MTAMEAEFLHFAIFIVFFSQSEERPRREEDVEGNGHCAGEGNGYVIVEVSK